MRTQDTYGMCSDETIPADGISYEFKPDINEDGAPIAWERGVVAVSLAAVSGYGTPASVQFAVSLSHDNATWFDVSVYDLTETAGGGTAPVDAQRQIQAAAVEISGEVSQSIMGIETSAPYMRVLVTNNGSEPATLSMWFYATR